MSSEPIKFWDIVKSQWEPPQPKTLADCVGCVPVVVESNFEWHVLVRHGNDTRKWDPVASRPTGNLSIDPSAFKFIAYVSDPPKLPLRLEDIPDRRVIQFGDNPAYCWKYQNRVLRLFGDGLIRYMDREEYIELPFVVANYVAVFQASGGA